jgi:hypothetical protein
MFIQGPLPLPWFRRVFALRGQKVLVVALVIWLLAGLRKRRSNLKLSTKSLQEYGINRDAKYKSLKKLEQAGLIRVERRGTRNPIVTILEVGEDSPA